MRNRLVAALVALSLALLLPFAAGAQTAVPNTAPASGKPPTVTPLGLWDGTSVRIGAADPNGIQRVTEEYPFTTATANPFTAANLVPVTTSLAQIGNGWSAYPYGFRSLYVKRTCASGTGADPTYLYLYSSEDNTTFYPVTSPSAFAAPWANSDTTKVDTLMIRLPSNLTVEYLFPLPAETYGYLGKYLAIFAKRDGSVVQNLTLVWNGRQK